MTTWSDQYEVLTWKKYIILAYDLAEKIAKSQLKFDLIVTIARGGLILSRLLSDTLQLPIAAFTVESYLNLQQQKIPHITHGLTTSLKNKKILLIDEISDTGKTFVRGLAYLEELGASKSNIKTCALHLKSNTQFIPDFFTSKTDKWIIYPYEIRETIEALVPVWKKDGLSPTQIKHRFLYLKISKRQIDKYLNKVGP